MNSRLHAVCDGAGRPGALFLTAGQISDFTGAAALLSSLPAAKALLADLIRSNRIYGLNETALHGELAARIVQDALGYRGPSKGAEYTLSTEQTILRGSVDLALGRFGARPPKSSSRSRGRAPTPVT